jgi:hypothetical protein
LFEFIVMVHVPVPVHAPLQPANTEPVVGVAVRITFVVEVYVSVQSFPQLMPDGLDVIVPDPVPDLVTVRV